MKVEVVSTEVVGEWLRELREAGEFSITLVFLFIGDRLSCCDEAVALREESGAILGIATIAPKGEECSGQPAIVGVYIRPGYRRRGFAVALTEATIQRCLDRGFRKVRVDVISAHFLGVLEKIAPELRAALDVHDMSGGLPPLE